MFFAARSIPTAVARRTKATWATQGLWPGKATGGKPAVASETLYKNIKEMHPNNQHFVKENWLSDPSVYPLIAIMATAGAFIVVMGANALFGYKDVQIDPRKRNSMLQTWGQEERIPITYRVHRATAGGRGMGHMTDNPEGLGVDHAKWQKEHDQRVGK